MPWTITLHAKPSSQLLYKQSLPLTWFGDPPRLTSWCQRVVESSWCWYVPLQCMTWLLYTDLEFSYQQLHVVSWCWYIPLSKTLTPFGSWLLAPVALFQWPDSTQLDFSACLKLQLWYLYSHMKGMHEHCRRLWFGIWQGQRDV